MFISVVDPGGQLKVGGLGAALNTPVDPELKSPGGGPDGKAPRS
jgi:hypothetical protein